MERIRFSQYPTRLLPVRNGVEALAKLGETVKFKKGEMVAIAGIIPEYCYLVKSGSIVALEYTSFGEERLYNIMEPGTMLLEPNLLCSFPPAVDFAAEEVSVLIRIRREILLKAMAADPVLNMDILESVATKFFAAMEQIRESNNHTVPWKVCNLLLVMADRYGIPDGEFTRISKKITQKTMAGMIGVNRVTLSRIMKVLIEDGVVNRIEGFYQICSLRKMQDYQERIDQTAYKSSENKF